MAGWAGTDSTAPARAGTGSAGSNPAEIGSAGRGRFEWKTERGQVATGSAGRDQLGRRAARGQAGTGSAVGSRLGRLAEAGQLATGSAEHGRLGRMADPGQAGTGSAAGSRAAGRLAELPGPQSAAVLGSTTVGLAGDNPAVAGLDGQPALAERWFAVPQQPAIDQRPATETTPVGRAAPAGNAAAAHLRRTPEPRPPAAKWWAVPRAPALVENPAESWSVGLPQAGSGHSCAGSRPPAAEVGSCSVAPPQAMADHQAAAASVGCHSPGQRPAAPGSGLAQSGLAGRPSAPERSSAEPAPTALTAAAGHDPAAQQPTALKDGLAPAATGLGPCSSPQWRGGTESASPDLGPLSGRAAAHQPCPVCGGRPRPPVWRTSRRLARRPPSGAAWTRVPPPPGAAWPLPVRRSRPRLCRTPGSSR